MKPSDLDDHYPIMGFLLIASSLGLILLFSAYFLTITVIIIISALAIPLLAFLRLLDDIQQLARMQRISRGYFSN